LQPGLVALGDQDIVALRIGYLLGQIPLAKDGVTDDYLTAYGNQAE